MFKESFFDAMRHYTNDASATALWEEIEKAYSGSGRYYHNLAHLENMLKELLSHQHAFKHWDTVVFALAYHDVVYNTLKSNNEEKSAALAEERLKKISFPANQITECSAFILATKGHKPSHEEVNLFTDADLSILGADADTYRTYALNIRREYSWYPSLIYNHGRKKVVHHFLDQARIFKTEPFFSKYESNARRNLKLELGRLRREA